MTKDEALTCKEFHYPVNFHKCDKWRRNGATKLWKTRPNEFRIPVKFGLYRYGYIDGLTGIIPPAIAEVAELTDRNQDMCVSWNDGQRLSFDTISNIIYNTF